MMPRISLSHSVNLVLLVVAMALGWTLFGRAPSRDDTVVRPVAEDISSSPLTAPGADAMQAISARLEAIDMRLSAIERGKPQGPMERTGLAAADKPISPQQAEIARGRLDAMFPDAGADSEDMFRFHAALANLPADEQIALTAALTQAINAGRIKLKI